MYKSFMTKKQGGAENEKVSPSFNIMFFGSERPLLPLVPELI